MPKVLIMCNNADNWRPRSMGLMAESNLAVFGPNREWWWLFKKVRVSWGLLATFIATFHPLLHFYPTSHVSILCSWWQYQGCRHQCLVTPWSECREAYPKVGLHLVTVVLTKLTPIRPEFYDHVQRWRSPPSILIAWSWLSIRTSRKVFSWVQGDHKKKYPQQEDILEWAKPALLLEEMFDDLFLKDLVTGGRGGLTWQANWEFVESF